MIAPGTSYVGTWSIATLVNGRLSTISGSLWHSPNPSIVWFWPIVVLIACAFAGWRLRSARLDRRLTRVLAIVVLAAVGVGGAARQLYGRPGVPAVQVVLVAILVAFSLWGIARGLLGRAGFILHIITAGVAFWVGIELLPTLWHAGTRSPPDLRSWRAWPRCSASAAAPRWLHSPFAPRWTSPTSPERVLT